MLEHSKVAGGAELATGCLAICVLGTQEQQGAPRGGNQLRRVPPAGLDSRWGQGQPGERGPQVKGECCHLPASSPAAGSQVPLLMVGERQTPPSHQLRTRGPFSRTLSSGAGPSLRVLPALLPSDLQPATFWDACPVSKGVLLLLSRLLLEAPPTADPGHIKAPAPPFALAGRPPP